MGDPYPEVRGTAGPANESLRGRRVTVIALSWMEVAGTTDLSHESQHKFDVPEMVQASQLVAPDFLLLGHMLPKARADLAPSPACQSADMVTLPSPLACFAR